MYGNNFASYAQRLAVFTDKNDSPEKGESARETFYIFAERLDCKNPNWIESNLCKRREKEAEALRRRGKTAEANELSRPLRAEPPLLDW